MSSSSSSSKAVGIPSGLKVPLPEYSGKHSTYVAWISKFVPYLTIVIGISIVLHDGTLARNFTQDEEEMLMFILTQALSGRAARIARKFKTGAKTWKALRDDFEGPAGEKLQAALVRLRTISWKHERSYEKAVERFQDQIDTVVEEITTYGGQQDFALVRSHVLSVLPAIYDSARSEIMQASDVEGIFSTIAAHAAILDSRQTTTTSAALYSGGRSAPNSS